MHGNETTPLAVKGAGADAELLGHCQRAIQSARVAHLAGTLARSNAEANAVTHSLQKGTLPAS